MSCDWPPHLLASPPQCPRWGLSASCFQRFPCWRGAERWTLMPSGVSGPFLRFEAKWACWHQLRSLHHAPTACDGLCLWQRQTCFFNTRSSVCFSNELYIAISCVTWRRRVLLIHSGRCAVYHWLQQLTLWVSHYVCYMILFNLKMCGTEAAHVSSTSRDARGACMCLNVLRRDKWPIKKSYEPDYGAFFQSGEGFIQMLDRGVNSTIAILVWKTRVKSHPGRSLAPLVLRCLLTSDNTNVWRGEGGGGIADRLLSREQKRWCLSARLFFSSRSLSKKSPGDAEFSLFFRLLWRSKCQCGLTKYTTRSHVIWWGGRG